MKPYMDWYTAPLNPCSVESLPEPVTLANGRRVWPVALSCYELLLQHPPQLPTEESSQPATTTTTTNAVMEQRVGHLELHLIQVPDIMHQVRCMPLQFQKNPYTILSAAGPTAAAATAKSDQQSQSSGILDGKWSALPPSGSSPNQDQNWCFAIAHSSGQIQLHALSVRQNPSSSSSSSSSLLDYSLDQDTAQGDDYNPEDHLSSLISSYSMSCSEPPPVAAAAKVGARPPLCLSLAWDSPAAYKRSTDCSSDNNNNNLQRMVSTYSDGRVAIHDLVFVLDDTTTKRTPTRSTTIRSAVDEYQPAWDQQQISATWIPRDCWQAHTLFHNTPAEVWSACFVGSSTSSSSSSTTTNVVWSGGDEGHLKVWDIRAPLRPVQVVREAFGAGITCLSPHPTMETIVAVGSCA